MISVSGPLAFAAGLASFLSPCVLPLVPAYLAYLAGGAGRLTRGRMVLGALAFTTGLAAVLVVFFYAFDITLASLRPWVAPIAGAVVILLALGMLLGRRFPLLNVSVSFLPTPGEGGPVRGFVVGAGFGLGWTPCIGPTLGAVLTSGYLRGATPQGFALLLAYCVGLGLPFVLLAIGWEEAQTVVAALRRHQRAFEVGGAVVLAAMGVLLLTDNFVLLNQALSHILPAPLQTPFGL